MMITSTHLSSARQSHLSVSCETSLTYTYQSMTAFPTVTHKNPRANTSLSGIHLQIIVILVAGCNEFATRNADSRIVRSVDT